MNVNTLAAALGCSMLRAGTYAQPLTDAMEKWGIDTPLRQAAFLGQISHETAGLTILKEHTNYSAKNMMACWPSRFPDEEACAPYVGNPEALLNWVYGGRMGNSMDGDGFAFIGRGCMQLTGRDSYQGYAEASGIDCPNDPELVCQPEYAADSAAWEWNQKGCNEYADARDIRTVTRLINGGYIGLANRQACTARALKALGV